MTKRTKLEPEVQSRVFLVDADMAFGSQLAQLFHRSTRFRICGQVTLIQGAPERIAAQSPDLVVVAAEAGNLEAARLIRALAYVDREYPVLAVSRNCDPAHAEKILSLGASGMLLKSEPAEEILAALQNVSKGQPYVSRRLTLPLLKRLLEEPSEFLLGGMESLTDREFQILELLKQGQSTREIATRLELSIKTVENHRTKIQHRLGMNSASALSNWNFARGKIGGKVEESELGRRISLEGPEGKESIP